MTTRREDAMKRSLIERMRDFAPLIPSSQPTRIVPGYLRSERRTPEHPGWPRAISTADVTASRFPLEAIADRECDLSVMAPGRQRAMGQLIVLTGHVLDEAGQPVRNTLIEMWQANAAGRYIHKNDGSPAPLDPNFLGLGRAITDNEGRYRFKTIKPGGYAVPHEGSGSAAEWWRPPHIHLSLFGPQYTSRLVTQIYFPGDPLNERDLLLNSIRDPAARLRLISHFAPHLNTADGALGFEHDLVLRGKFETPFEGR
jgi:protocatechuate 3,4-dioxygenase beta subunit